MQILATHVTMQNPENVDQVTPRGADASRAVGKPAAEYELLHAAVVRQLNALQPGDGLPALANVERAVALELGAAAFHDFGHGSLLELISGSSSLVALASQLSVAGAATPEAGIGWGAVRGKGALTCKDLVGQVLASLPSGVSSDIKEAAVADILCRQSGGTPVEKLCLGCSLADLVAAAEEAAAAAPGEHKQHGASADMIIGAATLLSSVSPYSAVAPQGVGSMLGSLAENEEASAACLSLTAAPTLTDLLSWSQWAAAFEPSLGPLPQFLRHRRELADEFRVLATADGRLLKLPPHGTMDVISEALQAGYPEAAVAALLSVIADNRSLELSPVPRLVTAVTKGMQKASGTHRSNGNLEADGESPEAAAVLVCLRAIALLPEELRSPVAEAVFLPALTNMTCKRTLHRLLAEAAAVYGSDEERVALKGLGLKLKVAAWSDLSVAVWHSFGKPDGGNAGTSEALSGTSKGNDLSRVAAETPQTPPRKESPSWLAPIRSLEASKTARVILEHPSGVDDSSSGSEEVRPSFVGACDTGGGADGGSSGLEEVTEAEARVERIRRSRGVLPDSEAADESVPELQRILGNTCDKISSDLYSEDSHFVMELIQNADDNKYDVAQGIDPTLCFIVGKASITVLNNEVGFSHDNIKALCSAGDSLKEKKAGYIGQVRDPSGVFSSRRLGGSC